MSGAQSPTRSRLSETLDPSWFPGCLCPSSRPPQECIDWNREVLKRELGLTEQDIVDIPQLFFLKDSYAEAFFPDMVRVWREDRSFPSLVLGGVLLGSQLGVQRRSRP